MGPPGRGEDLSPPDMSLLVLSPISPRSPRPASVPGPPRVFPGAPLHKICSHFLGGDNAPV